MRAADGRCGRMTAPGRRAFGTCVLSPSAPFIRRPVATSLLMAAILLVGLIGFRFLPLSALPEVDYPTIQVQTFYPGASPEVMAATVTAPLEVQFGQMSDLARMASVSSGRLLGSITLQFNLDLGLDVAEQEVQAAINAATSLLPTDLPAPPIYAKVNPADAPILTLALTSRTAPMTEVEAAAEQRLAQKISQIGGVGLVAISGGQRPAVRIDVNSRQLASYGLSLSNVTTAIARGERQWREGLVRRADARLCDRRQRPARAPRRLRPADHRLSATARAVRLGDVAKIAGGAREQPAGRDLRHDAGDRPQRPAAAGRECHRARSTRSRPPCLS